jgi:hypothetical protein
MWLIYLNYSTEFKNIFNIISALRNYFVVTSRTELTVSFRVLLVLGKNTCEILWRHQTALQSVLISASRHPICERCIKNL